MNSQWQRFDQMMRPQGHIFYGWYIVLAGAGIQWLAGVLWMQSYGAYMVLLQDEFGWSKALMAAGFALTRIESGVLGPLQGWMVDRFGPQAILRIGTVMFALGFMLFSQVNSLLTFYLTFALIAIGSSLGGFATVIVSIVNWFNRNRAKAVSWSQIGFSLGGLSVPIVILALDSLGWRVTAFLSGIVVLIVGLPLAQVIRHRPDPMGEGVDGLSVAKTSPNPGIVLPKIVVKSDFTAREAMRTPAFWLISLGHASALLSVSAVMVHLIPHLTEGLNYSLIEAGGIVALMTALQICGQLAGGYLGDRFDKRLICIICMAGHTIGLLLLAFASNWWMVVVFTILHGTSWGMRGPLMVALRADYFGPSSFGAIMGFSSLIVMLGMSSGPIIAGYMADVSGNYRTGLAFLACCTFVGSLGFIFARPPEIPERTAAD